MTDTPNNVNTDEKTDEEEDKEKDDVSIDEGDKKPAAKPKKSAQDQNKRRFYAIRKSDTLKTPAIFLSWDDASLYLEDQDDTEIPPEYQIFDTLDEATQYIHSFLDTKKRKSAASLPRPAGKKRRIKASEKNNWQSEWMNKFQENWAESSKVFLVKMKQYEEKYGNCDVPVRSAQLEEDCVPLAKWIQKTRQFIKAYNKDPASSFLTEEQVNQLLNAGFPVNVTRGSKPSRSKASVSDKNRKELEETWDEMVEQLKKYKETFGGCDVPKRSKVINEKWQPLGKWVDKVRGYIKKHEEDPDSSILDDERVKELMDLGFVKTTTRGKKAQGSASETENFEKYLEIHKQVLEEKIPVKSNLKLQNWVMKQRKEYQKFKDGQPSTMTAERLVRLTEAGFVFHPKQKMTWEERALSWLAYKTKHGTDPKRYSEDGLGKWILTQRTKYVMFKTGEKTNLTQDQIKRLTDWGFAWESKIKKPLKRADPLPWAERFKQLIRYRKIHGHTLVPQRK